MSGFFILTFSSKDITLLSLLQQKFVLPSLQKQPYSNFFSKPSEEDPGHFLFRKDKSIVTENLKKLEVEKSSIKFLDKFSFKFFEQVCIIMMLILINHHGY